MKTSIKQTSSIMQNFPPKNNQCKQVWWVIFSKSDGSRIQYPVPFKLTDRQLRRHKKRLYLYGKVKFWYDPKFKYIYGPDVAHDKLLHGGFLNNDRTNDKKEFERLYSCQF